MNRREQRITSWRQRRRAANQGPGIAGCLLWLGGGCLLLTLLITGLSVAMTAGAVGGVYAYFAQDLPGAEAIETEQVSFETVKIWDRTGQHLLYEAIDPRPYRGDRTYVTLDQISPYLIEATVALEDRSFYENPGINPRGLIRAFVQNLSGGQVQGGSSITQQLIKNVLIEREQRYQRLYSRKIKEVILAVEPPLSQGSYLGMVHQFQLLRQLRRRDRGRGAHLLRQACQRADAGRGSDAVLAASVPWP
jgi:hypothetical protein